MNRFEIIEMDELRDIDGGFIVEALVVGAITTVVCWGIDSACEKLTGKSVAEHVADKMGW